MTPTYHTKGRKVMFSAPTLSACLWLAIGGIVWSFVG